MLSQQLHEGSYTSEALSHISTVVLASFPNFFVDS